MEKNSKIEKSNKFAFTSNKMPSMKFKFYLWIICYFLTTPYFHLMAGTDDTISLWSVRMAESVMMHSSHIDVYGEGCSSYVYATAMKGFRELWQATGDTTYFQYITSGVNKDLSFFEDITNYEIHDIDPVNAGSLFLFMYSQTGEEKYKSAADSTLKFLKSFPRTADSGFYHKDVPRMQLDDLYMANPFLAEYGQVFNKPEEYAEAVRQCILMEKHTRDPETGLLYHAWYEKKYYDIEPGCTPFFWGRGVGWVAMALVDVLDFLPHEYSGRDSVVLVFQRLAEAISNVQDTSTGLWWQVLDQGGISGNFLESSASCMFVYSLAKGIRLGYIDSSYLNSVEKGIQGIVNDFIVEDTDGTISITNVCPGQGPASEYSGYVRTPTENDHAVGPFIMASLETEKLNIHPIVDVKQDVNPGTLFMSNYPNPFNDITTLTCSIPQTAYVTLDIYNILGEKVERLVEGIKPAGTFTCIFNSSGQNSGIYICRLQVGNEVMVDYMILLR